MKKKFCLLVAVALMAAYILPLSKAIAAAPPNPADYAILDINGSSTLEEINNEASATATFENGSLTISGAGLYSQGSTVYAPAGSNVTLDANGTGGYVASLMINGTDTHGSTSHLDNITGITNIDVNFAFPTATSTINYTPTSDPVDRLTINDGEFDFSSNQISYTYDGSGTVNIAMETFATLAYITAVNINGTDYAVPTAPADILNLMDGQVFRYEFNNVPKADTYNIATTTTRSDLMGGFSWSYKDIDKENDNYIGNGYLEVIEVEFGGVKYQGEAAIIAANLPYLQLNRTPTGDYGEIMLPTGSEVTLRLIPDAGYQLTSFTVNGGEFEAQEEIGAYSFVSAAGNYHLGAHFTAVDDAVAANADAITSGTITLGGDEFVSGTARLDVNDVDLDKEDIAEFEDAAGDYKVKTYLDISLFQTIFKGSDEDAWDTQIDELNHEATITLKLDESIDGNDIVIVHQKHDGTYEVIPTTYDPVAHTITFKTSSFSNYAIATKTIGSPDTGVMTSETSSVVEDNTGLAILGTLALWGFLAFVAKKILA